MANAAEIAREREQVLAASQEPMALTDCDRHVTVNRPYADLYGFTGPDEIEGEPWTRCIAEDGRGRFEREIVPDCRADGEWRGTVVGRRRDGTTFPQELSIAWLDDGNFVCTARETETDGPSESVETGSRHLLIEHVFDAVGAAYNAVGCARCRVNESAMTSEIRERSYSLHIST
jgi:PAS domain S-box-containing protein